MDGWKFDAAGNLLQDAAHSYTYDAEGRVSAVDDGSTATYTYDAERRRVSKTANGGAVYYLYDLAGHAITELDGSGGWMRGEIYAIGQHLATYANSTIYFDHTDWLGTERVRTDATGAAAESCTSLPFGDWMNCSGSDASPLHFTGKQRDQETGLDYFGARYDASSLGRFMTPDWSAKLEPVPYAKLDDPQSLNLYSYVRNNPLSRNDPSGHADIAAECKGQATCTKTITQTVGIYHYDRKTKKSVLDSTLRVTTKFNLTADAKGNVNVAASSTVSNVSGYKYSDSQLTTMGKEIGAVQQSAVMMGFGQNTTQLMTAVAANETAFGTAKASEKSPFKAPDINPLQLSGGRANGDLMHNIQGALDVFDYFGSKVDFAPIPTYSGYSDNSTPTMTNFTAVWGSVTEKDQ